MQCIQDAHPRSDTVVAFTARPCLPASATMAQQLLLYGHVFVHCRAVFGLEPTRSRLPQVELDAQSPWHSVRPGQLLVLHAKLLET